MSDILSDYMVEMSSLVEMEQKHKIKCSTCDKSKIILYSGHHKPPCWLLDHCVPSNSGV